VLAIFVFADTVEGALSRCEDALSSDASGMGAAMELGYPRFRVLPAHHARVHSREDTLPRVFASIEEGLASIADGRVA
jgi:hypothetical protein